MPTLEQWRQYANGNPYRPQPSPEGPALGRQIGAALSAHINRPDAGQPNLYPVNAGSWGGMAAPPQPAGLPPPNLTDSGVGAGPGAGSAGARPALPAPGQQPAELLPYLTPPMRQSGPTLTSLGNGYGVSGENTSGRAGYTSKTYYDPSGNVVASGLSSATGRGGFVGAATDAQADRAMQDRAAQSAAAQQNIASMNAAADAMRGLRAARLGVSAGVLDRMEGRNDTAAAAADSAAQGAIPAHWNSNPFSLPGDSFQDTRGRQAEYGRLLDQAASGNRGQRQGAMIGLQGLGGLMESNQKTALGLAGIDQRLQGEQADANAKIYAAMLRQQSDQQRNQQRFGLDARRFNLDVSRLNRDVANDQRKAQQQTPDQIKANLAAQIMAAHYNKDPAKLKELEERYWKLGFARQPEQTDGLTAPP